jgi:hypothetical protein
MLFPTWDSKPPSEARHGATHQAQHGSCCHWSSASTPGRGPTTERRIIGRLRQQGGQLVQADRLQVQAVIAGVSQHFPCIADFRYFRLDGDLPNVL